MPLDDRSWATFVGGLDDATKRRLVQYVAGLNQGEARAYQPSLRDRLGAAIAGDSRPGDVRYNLAQGLVGSAGVGGNGMGLADFTPAGGLLAMGDAAKMAREGDYLGAGINAAGAVLPASAAGMKAMRPNNMTIDDLLRMVQDEDVYVRWSAGPKYDMAPGARSRDYQSGLEHEGLSAVNLRGVEHSDRLMRYLRDYSYLVDKKGRPTKGHLYKGAKVGTDSDNADSIIPKEYVGTLSDEFVDFISDDANLKRLLRTEQVQTAKKAFETYKTSPASPFSPYTPEAMKAWEDELAALGGPAKIPLLWEGRK